MSLDISSPLKQKRGSRRPPLHPSANESLLRDFNLYLIRFSKIHTERQLSAEIGFLTVSQVSVEEDFVFGMKGVSKRSAFVIDKEGIEYSPKDILIISPFSDLYRERQNDLYDIILNHYYDDCA